MEGTITWFDSAKDLPPRTKLSNTSNLVLVYDPETKMANTDFYMHDTNQWFCYKNTTHWAYINRP